MPTQYFPPFFPYTDYLQSKVYEADGVTSTIPFSFGYVGKADFIGSNPSPYIKVYHLNPTTNDYTEVSFTMPSSSTVSISDDLESEGYYLIRSNHSLAARLVDYESGATASEQTLDLDSEQAWYLIREHYDRLLDVLYTAQSSNFDGAVFEFSGDDSTTDFRLTNSSWTVDELPSKAGIWCYINGAWVQWDDYELSQDTDDVVVLTLAQAPATGDGIEVRVAQKKAIAPDLEDGSIDSEHLADGIINSLDLFDLDAEGTARYVLGWNASVVFGKYPLDHNWITDFDTAVEAKRLDQFGAPTTSVSFNLQRIRSVATPTTDSDAATKEYVDDAVSGIGAGSSARFTVDVNVTSFPYTVASGLDEGIYQVDLVFVNNDNSGGAAYTIAATVNSVSRNMNIFNHPDGMVPICFPMQVEVTGAGTIVVNNVTNIYSFQGGTGYRIASS